MGVLDSVFGVKGFLRNGVELVTRKNLDVRGPGLSLRDDPTTETTVLEFSEYVGYRNAAELRAVVDSLEVGARVLTFDAVTAGDAGGATGGDNGHWEIALLSTLDNGTPGSWTDNVGTRIRGNTRGAVRRWPADRKVNAGWFGLTSGGTVNCRTQFAAAAALGLPVRAPRGRFRIEGGSVEFAAGLEGDGIQAFGDTTKGTSFTLVGDVALSFTGTVQLKGFTVFGNYQASNGIRLHNCNGSTIDDILVRETLRDGILPSENGNNNTVTCRGVSTLGCGSTYTTGTITAFAGDTVLTVTGAANLTTLGIRLGRDYFSAADDIDACNAAYAASGNPDDLPLPYEIVAVTSTTVEIYPALRHDLTSSAYAIRMGSGVCLAKNGDNGGWTFYGGAHQNNRSAGIQELSLYGAQTFGVVFEGNFVGRTIGRRSESSGTQVETTGWGFNRDYNETATTVDVLVAFANRGTLVDGSGSSHGDFETKVGVYLGSQRPAFLGDRTPLNRQANPYITFAPATALNRLTVVETSSDFEVAEVEIQTEGGGGLYAWKSDCVLQFRAPTGGLRFAAGAPEVTIEGAGVVYGEGLVTLTRRGENRWIANGRVGGPLAHLPSGVEVTALLCADYGLTYSGTMRGEGTSPPAITFTGAPLRPFLLDIVTGGPRGTATIRYSVNDGGEWSTPVTTAATLDFSTELGVTLSLASGTYDANNLYRPRVTTLADQGGEGNDVTQGTDGTRPVAVRWRNSRNAIRFFGAQNLSRTNFTGGALTQPSTRFVVGTWPASGTTTIVDGGAVRASLYQNSAAAALFAGSAVDVGAAVASEPYVAAISFDGANTYALIQFGTGAVLEATVNAGTNGQDGVTLGSDNGGSSFLTGLIALDMTVRGRMARRDLWQKFDDLRRYYGI